MNTIEKYDETTAGKPLISVVMPTYNAERYLREAIDSILHQSYGDFEFLIIDDNSRDKTREIIRSYKDERIKLIDGDCKGLAAALNKGIMEAQGEFIARMDADDISLPERFERQIKYFQENPSISLLGTWQEHFGMEISTHRPPAKPCLAKTSLLFGCDMCHSTVMFRKQIFLKNNLLYPTDSPQEDFELWGKAIGVVNVANLGEVLGKYRVCETSITNDKIDFLDNFEAKLAAKNLQRYFNIELKEDELRLVQRREPPYWHLPLEERVKFQKELDGLYTKIEKNNKKTKFMPPKELRQGLIYCFSVLCGNEKLIESYYRGKKSVFKTIIKNIFSINNSPDRQRKIITIAGFEIKLKKKGADNV